MTLLIFIAMSLIYIICLLWFISLMLKVKKQSTRIEGQAFLLKSRIDEVIKSIEDDRKRIEAENRDVIENLNKIKKI